MDHYENIRQQIHGPVMGMLTPFSEDGEVDLGSLPTYVEHLIGAGLRLLAFSPMVSSVYVQTSAEVLAVAAETKQIAGERALVLATTRGDTPHETYDLIAKLEKHQLDGVFVFPGWFGPKPHIYVDLLTNCCDCTSMPIFAFQVCVDFDRRLGGLPWMTMDLWEQLAENAQIVGLKDDTGNIELRKTIAKKFPRRFVIVGPGFTDRYIQVHDLPCQAELTSIAYLDPEKEVQFHKLYDAGKLPDAFAILHRASDTASQIRQRVRTPWDIGIHQALAHLRGFLASPALRAPLPSLSDGQIETVKELLAQFLEKP